MKIELTSYTNDDKGNTFNNKLTIEDDTSKIIHEKKKYNIDKFRKLFYNNDSPRTIQKLS